MIRRIHRPPDPCDDTILKADTLLGHKPATWDFIHCWRAVTCWEWDVFLAIVLWVTACVVRLMKMSFFVLCMGFLRLSKESSLGHCRFYYTTERAANKHWLGVNCPWQYIVYIWVSLYILLCLLSFFEMSQWLTSDSDHFWMFRKNDHLITIFWIIMYRQWASSAWAFIPVTFPIGQETAN